MSSSSMMIIMVMMMSKPARKTVIEIAEERGDFVKTEGGDIVWWPLGHRGYLTSDNLRELAAELDQRNRERVQND